MKKELLFDMDGTIADLYSVEDWLKKLRAEDPSPYREARPMYDMDTLSAVLEIFKGMGYRIAVVSWGSLGASEAYDMEVKKAKIEWLNRFDFPYDEIHVVKYGTPKANFIKSETSILIDDNKEVRENFLESEKGQEKRTIDATLNIIEQLVNLLVA